MSVIGSNDFDANEGTAAYLPDGSLGFPCRPTSAWYQSYDDGRTWSPPRRLLTDSIIEDPNFGIEYRGPQAVQKGRRGGDAGRSLRRRVWRPPQTRRRYPPGGEQREVIYSRDSGEELGQTGAGTRLHV